MAKVTKEQLLKLQKTLITDRAIGQKFGVSRQAIHQLREKYEIKANTAKNKERDEKIVKLSWKGTKASDIAKSVGVSISQIYRIIKRA